LFTIAEAHPALLSHAGVEYVSRLQSYPITAAKTLTERDPIQNVREVATQ
jgi:hypothetical protein